MHCVPAGRVERRRHFLHRRARQHVLADADARTAARLEASRDDLVDRLQADQRGPARLAEPRQTETQRLVTRDLHARVVAADLVGERARLRSSVGRSGQPLAGRDQRRAVLRGIGAEEGQHGPIEPSRALAELARGARQQLDLRAHFDQFVGGVVGAATREQAAGHECGDHQRKPGDEPDGDRNAQRAREAELPALGIRIGQYGTCIAVGLRADRSCPSGNGRTRARHRGPR